MADQPGGTKLAAIMSVDVAGYSAMSELDESEAIALVTRLRAALHQVAAESAGRIFNTAGDGFMLEFASAAGALDAAETLRAGIGRDRLRIGVHIGDVRIDANGDLLGHCVNVAARLQQMAQPGGVVVSMDVRRAVRGKLAQRLQAAGSVQLDKMSEAIEIFSLGAKAPARARERSEPILAILPFDNESDDAEMDYLSDGIADEIIFTLLRQSTLKVIGRTSAFQFRSERKSKAAAALGATHVLDGSVRCSGSKLRIGVQLIEAKSGIALWSEHYDGDRADVFTLEDAIAANVAAALKQSLSRSEHAAQPIDPAAYDLYLRARRNWLMLSDVEEEQAAFLLEHCVALAPNFAPGWASLASVRALLLPRSHDLGGEPRHKAALHAAERALELDPDCAQAFGALSLLKPAFAEHAEKLRLVGEALRRTPNDPALHLARAVWLYSVGRIDAAGRTLEVASRLEPLGPAVEGLRASLMTTRGEIDVALEIVRAAWARWPDSAFTWYMMWATSWVARRLDDAKALLTPEALPKRDVRPSDVETLRGYTSLLRMPKAEQIGACEGMLAEASKDGPLPIATCMIAAGLGCADQAFDAIDRALDDGRGLRPDVFDGFGMARAQVPLQFFVSNGGAPLWRHRRFPALSARLGLAQYWLATGDWPDCAREVDYDFKAACADAVR